MGGKFFEIIDSYTWIPVYAFKLIPKNIKEKASLRRSGYYDFSEYIFLMQIYGEHPKVNHDPYGWEGLVSNTMVKAHKYILKNWDELESGHLIDLQEQEDKDDNTA